MGNDYVRGYLLAGNVYWYVNFVMKYYALAGGAVVSALAKWFGVFNNGVGKEERKMKEAREPWEDILIARKAKRNIVRAADIIIEKKYN